MLLSFILVWTQQNTPPMVGNTDWLSLLYAAGKSLSVFLLKMLISLGFWDNKNIWFSFKTSDHKFSFFFGNCSLPFKTWSVLGLSLELHVFISFLHSLFFKDFLSFFYFLSMVVIVQVMELDPITSEEWAEKKDKKRQWRNSWKNQQMKSKLCVCGWVHMGGCDNSAWNLCYLVDYRNHFMMYMYIKSWCCTSQISTNLTLKLK